MSCNEGIEGGKLLQDLVLSYLLLHLQLRGAVELLWCHHRVAAERGKVDWLFL